MSPTRPCVIVVVACSLGPLSACTEASDVRDPDAPVEGIVYTTLRPPNLDIWLFDEPGSEPVRLTDHPALDYNAAFSPDGRWVVFTSERSGRPDLYALELDGAGEPVRLTQGDAMEDAATFSPDGTRLAFVSTRDGNADIFVMPFAPGDATADERAVNLTRRAGGDFHPVFSPDGSSIAFSRQDTLWTTDITRGLTSFAVDLYVMDADGSNVRRISEPGPGPDFDGLPVGRVSGSPAWSLDGRAIYYYRIDGDGAAIRRVAADGSDDTIITGTGLSPAVRRDGRIAFTQPQPGAGMDAFDALRTGRIVSVAPDGSDLRLESDTARSYFGADIDSSSGRMVAHGVGPVDGVPVIGNGSAFSPPGADRPVQLARRTVEVRGVRGYFPAITPAGEVLTSPLHLVGARPAIPLQASALDGSGLRDVFTPESGIAWGAAVAGDVNDVVFAVGPPFAPGEAGVDIWRVRLDDGHATNLSAGISANDALPHVSPDGRRIVFRSGGDGSGTIHIMDGEGGDRRRLTDEDAIETMPALSPDGEWVVFPTNLAENRKLWIQRVGGSDGRYLEPDRLDIPDFSMHPRFSPDGDWIVFTSDRGGFNDEWPLTWFPQPYGDLWAVPVAGGEAMRLTNNKWEDGPSDWGFVQLPAR